MEHFKKRLIHQHQKPPEKNQPLKAMVDDGDDTSSSSSNNSGFNETMQIDKKKEGNTQTKIARKRAVCRSKFRHDSLKIFKLGTSIPTSLCKSKEPYNVSAKKNIQLCCEDVNANKNNKNEDKPILKENILEPKMNTVENNTKNGEKDAVSKESITEQIINTIEGNNKKENLQRSTSVNLDYSTIYRGKHNLPPIISEIPTHRRRNSLSRSSEDEQKFSSTYTTTTDDSKEAKSNNFKPHLISHRRQTVIGNETPKNNLNQMRAPNGPECKQPLSDQYQTQHKLLDKPERISPDSTYPERETSRVASTQLLKYLTNKTSSCFAPDVIKTPHNIPMSLPPIKINLPHNTSITPVNSSFGKPIELVTQNNITAGTSLTQHNFHYDSINSFNKSPNPSLFMKTQKETGESNNDLENPINLSIVKDKNELQTISGNIPNLTRRDLTHKSNHMPLLNPDTGPTGKKNQMPRNPVSENSHQISRLPNVSSSKPQATFAFYNPVEERMRSSIQMAYKIMYEPFSVENLIALNYYYKILLDLIGSKDLSGDTIQILRKVIDELIVYVNLKLFDETSAISTSYTHQIMELNLEVHIVLLKDVIHLIRKYLYDQEWMGHLLRLLSQKDTNYSSTYRVESSRHIPNNWINSHSYLPMIPSYFPREEAKSKQKVQVQKLQKSKSREAKNQSLPHRLPLTIPNPLYSSELKNDNYPSDSRYIPPKVPFLVIPKDKLTKKGEKTNNSNILNNGIKYKNKPHKDGITKNQLIDEPYKLNNKYMEYNKPERAVVPKSYLPEKPEESNNDNSLNNFTIYKNIPQREVISSDQLPQKTNNPNDNNNNNHINNKSKILVSPKIQLAFKPNNSNINNNIAGFKNKPQRDVIPKDHLIEKPTDISNSFERKVTTDRDRSTKEQHMPTNAIPNKFLDYNNKLERDISPKAQGPSKPNNDRLLINNVKKEQQDTLKIANIDKENDFTSNAERNFVNGLVIIKDESMEVTKEDKEKGILEFNKTGKNKTLVVENKINAEITDIKNDRSEKNRSKTISSGDLHLFKEFLRQEEPNIYNKILNKINRAKETAKEVITIDDEEDLPTPKYNLEDGVPQSHLPKFNSQKVNSNSNCTEVVIIDDDEDKSIKVKNLDSNQNYITVKNLSSLNKIEPEKPLVKISVRSLTPEENISKSQISNKQGNVGEINLKNSDVNFVVTSLNPLRTTETPRNELKLSIAKPYVNQISTDPTVRLNCQIIESPELFTPPSNTGRPYFGSYSSTSTTTSCVTPENLPPMVPPPALVGSPAPVTPNFGMGTLSTNSNWTSWISEERRKGFLDAEQPCHRRQSIETISSVGSDYSPNLEHDDDSVKIRVDTKWYRVKKTVMESIPLGKLCYVREKNYLVRYFDDNQLKQFIQNMDINLTGPTASEFLKQIRERVRPKCYLSEDIYISPFEIASKNEIIQLAENIYFTEDDYIEIPELYVDEVEKVEKFVPKDFIGYYKYVTGYQIVNHNHPISFQTFLTMHNTSSIKTFYKRYLLSVLGNRNV